jgi:hypothetical protein
MLAKEREQSYDSIADFGLEVPLRVLAATAAGTANRRQRLLEFEVPKPVCRDMIGTSNSPH